MFFLFSWQSKFSSSPFLFSFFLSYFWKPLFQTNCQRGVDGEKEWEKAGWTKRSRSTILHFHLSTQNTSQEIATDRQKGGQANTLTHKPLPTSVLLLVEVRIAPLNRERKDKEPGEAPKSPSIPFTWLTPVRLRAKVMLRDLLPFSLSLSLCACSQTVEALRDVLSSLHGFYTLPR